jgi:pyridinium-3,5-bisthiocarboxylic acid mononucleotide nickel chelatase
VTKQGISAVYVDVVGKEDDKERTLKEILELIDHSTMPQEVKQLGKRIFLRLGEAEAKVHNQDVNKVRLHEIGAVDTFIDIFGAVISLKMLGIEKISSSPLNLGKGLVRCAHGVLPVPAPITAELLRGVPVYATDVEGELTTPTGAAIITSLATDFGNMPSLTMQRVGYGAGKMDLEIPNLLRVFMGETVGQPKDYISEYITILETNIDDMNPQFYDHIMGSLLDAGALDVFITPVQMKKNRPGIVLTASTGKENLEKLLDILFKESTTLGVRVKETHRLSLPRSHHLVNTKFGEIRVKVALKGSTIIKVAPEYEDCRKAATTYQVPISQVYAEAQRVGMLLPNLVSPTP